MSELRIRTLAPPPPRHPAVRPPSPNPQPRSSIMNAPLPPLHPSHPSLPPRLPPSPRPGARLEYFGSESMPSQAAATLDMPQTPHVQTSPPPIPPNRPIPEGASPGLPPQISRTSSLSSVTSFSTIPPPVHHATKERSPTSESSYEAGLSEKELRDLYDDEEIDRFLRLFSAFVNEVKLNDDGQSAANVEFTAAADGIVVENPEDNGDKDWISLSDAGESLGLPHSGSQPRTMSERIAQKFIAPYLPKTTKTIPPFTILRFRLTVQRLYLALEPSYQFTIDNLVSLALWEDKNWSLGLCLGYWVLWLHDLVLPSFIFYLLYILLHRRMRPYPSLAQLREYRTHVDKANEFGDELQRRFTADSPFGLFDAWKTLKVYNKGKLRKGKEKMKYSDDTASVMNVDAEATATDGDTAIADDSTRALLLEALCQVADGLERIKNLFLWRKPSASYAFGIVLGFLGFVTFVLPAQWLAKIMYFVLGFAFWHVPPVLAALPAGDHRRVLALAHNLPTDADYATELIAQRVARGQEIKPLNRKRKAPKMSDINGPPDVHTHDTEKDGKPSGLLRQGVSVLKTVADTGYQAIGGQKFIHNNFAPAAVRGAGQQGGSRSYPAQHGKTPGVITVSTEMFYFTPLLSGSNLEIPVENIVGIKKATPKGISIRVRDMNQEGGERKEKFLLVFERDELFGRMVGMGGKKWTRI